MLTRDTSRDLIYTNIFENTEKKQMKGKQKEQKWKNAKLLWDHI